MKFIKMFESFSISAEFRKYVNGLEEVKATLQEDNVNFTYAFNLYETPEELSIIGAEYIIKAQYFSGMDADYEDDEDEYSIQSNTNDYYVYVDGAFRRASDDEDEAIREYEDYETDLMNHTPEDSLVISDVMKQTREIEKGMQSAAREHDDKIAIEVARDYVYRQKGGYNKTVTPENKVMGFKTQKGFVAKSMDYLDPEFHHTYTLFRMDIPQLREEGFTHFIMEFFTSSNESMREFTLIKTDGKPQWVVGDDTQDDLLRGSDDKKQYFDRHDLTVCTIYNYFGDEVTQSEEEYQMVADRAELQSKLDQAVSEEDYETAEKLRREIENLRRN